MRRRGGGRCKGVIILCEAERRRREDVNETL